MARPVKANAEHTRARIREAAMALFAENGVDATGVRSIAVAAGVSPGTVNLYFGSKQGLYAACLEAMYNDIWSIRPAIERALIDRGSPAELADSTVRTAFRLLRQHQRAVRLFMRGVAATGEVDEFHRATRQRPLLDGLTDMLSSLLDQPALETRLGVQTLMAAMARYALSSDTELKLFAGLNDDDDAELALHIIEDHLVLAACRLLQVPRIPPGEHA